MLPASASTAGPATDAAIVARSLRRTFKGGIEAVRDIDLTVDRGDVFGFLGPGGAGKTTTVRMLCTLLPPDRRGPPGDRTRPRPNRAMWHSSSRSR